MRKMQCDVCSETITTANVFVSLGENDRLALLTGQQHLHDTPQRADHLICEYCEKDSENLSSLMARVGGRSLTCEVPRRDVVMHRWNCHKARVACPHARHGCPVAVARQDLTEHIAICPFEQLSGFMNDTMRRLTNQESQIARLDRMVNQVAHRLHPLLVDRTREVREIRQMRESAEASHRAERDLAEIELLWDTVDELTEMVETIHDLVGTGAESLRRSPSQSDAPPSEIASEGPVRLTRRRPTPSSRQQTYRPSPLNPELVTSRIEGLESIIRNASQPHFTDHVIYIARREIISLRAQQTGAVAAPPMEEPRTRSVTEEHAIPDLYESSTQSPQFRAPRDTQVDGHGPQTSLGDRTGMYQGSDNIGRTGLSRNPASMESRSSQPFSDLAFARFGFQNPPANPSGPQEVDDQLGELRSVVSRLAEGMDTMERQNQACVCTSFWHYSVLIGQAQCYRESAGSRRSRHASSDCTRHAQSFVGLLPLLC